MNGILGQILGGMVGGNLGRRGRGGGSAVLNGLLVALAVKAAQHYMQRGQTRSFDPRAAPANPSRGGPGGLGGLAGAGGGLGDLLGGLGGAGALGALLDQLRRNGLGDQVDSWVRPGPNARIAPTQLAAGLGDDTVDALSEETGMPRDVLLSELSETLPAAVDHLTPEGRQPSDDDIRTAVGRA